MRVAVVIPCLNEVGYIEGTINSLLESDLEGIALEVLVVDGISSDGTIDIVRRIEKQDQRVRLISNEKKVTPVALNLGIKQANDAEIIIILGAHSEVNKDFVKRNAEVLRDQPQADCVGGLIDNVFENETAQIVGIAMSSPFGVGNATFRTGGKPGFVETVAFGAYRREVFLKIGFFDERLVRNQDDEFNFRIIKNGGKIYFDPSIRSKYYVRSSYKKLSKQYFQYGYWKVYVNALHNTVTTWRQTVPFFFVLFLTIMTILTLIDDFFFRFLLAGISAWFIGSLFAAMERRCPSWQWHRLILVFLILHLSYGTGYAKGIIDFLILKKRPDTESPNITR